jgi:CubicO group peptidase (beta-lactamase class C family)
VSYPRSERRRERCGSLLGTIYSALMIGFGWALWKWSTANRALRMVGLLLVTQAVFGFVWPPMHQRAVLASGGSTITDTLHLAWMMATGLFFMFAMGFGATALGKRFRVYSIVTMAIVVACGAWTGTYAARIQADLPTPGVGIWERISIAAFMSWVAVLSFSLLRKPASKQRSESRDGAALERVEGYASSGFHCVREAFAENFSRRDELGGACAVYHGGEKVVDLWGGIRNTRTGERWDEDTMVVVHSATKGLAAMTLAIAHSRGWLDYEERVCAYWPEFAQQGKASITVRQLLAHQAGLFAISEPVDRTTIADLDRLAVVLARQKPAWEPGTRQAYHGLTLGFYEGELLRRIDPRHRSLGQFFQDEIASPLGLDVYLRLPDTIPNTRLATLAPPGRVRMLVDFPLRFTLEAMNPRSNIYRALAINPGTAVYLDDQRVYARNLEVPSGNAVGTARAIARAYSVFATGGHELGVRKETLDLLSAPAIPPAGGFYDECLKTEVQFSLGFMKPSPVWPFGGPTAFGSPGAGGALGFADPSAGIGYAYVTSQMGTTLTGDPRDVALREALYAAIPGGVSSVAA